MIWIATLCLLAIAAWLFFNALNERRWVEAHSHDETVAADPGILPDFSRLTSSARAEGRGKVSIDEEDSRFARAVAKVREKTEKAGERIERRAAEARERDEGETFFGRAVAKVGGRVRELDDRLDSRMKRSSESRVDSVTEEDSLLGRAAARVARKEEEVGARTRERVRRSVADYNATTRAEPSPSPSAGAKGEGFFDRMVERVSGRLDRMERRLDTKAERARSADEDFLTRTSAKVGGRINEIDERIVDKSREVAQRIDKKTDL